MVISPILNEHLPARLPGIPQDVLDFIADKAHILSMLQGPDVDYITIWKNGEKWIELAYMSKEITRMIGRSQREIYESGWGTFVLKFPAGLSREEQQRLRENDGLGEENVSMYAVSIKGGSHQWFEDRSKIIKGTGGYSLAIGTLIPRSERDIERDEILRQIDARLKMVEAENDKLKKCPLTGVFTRRVFEELLSVSRLEQNPWALLYFDLDKFKEANDKFGHDGGDLVLRAWAHLLKRTLRKKADIIGRWWGDEFVAYLPSLTKVESLDAAERILHTWKEKKIPIRGQEVEHDVSIGVAFYHTGDTLPTIMKRADDAMYESKRKGRGCVSYSE